MMIRTVRILFQYFYYLGFERVLFDVAHQGIKIGFIGDIPRFEPSLPEVSYSFVFFIEVNGVVHIELSHILGEVFLSDFQKDMIMVIHETIVMDSNTVSFGIKAHQLFKVGKIGRFFKNRSLFYTSVDDVVVSIYLYAWSSWHIFLSTFESIA
jgi:hypothetical protein